MSFWGVPRELDPRLWRVLGGVFVSFLGVGLTLPYLLVYLHDVRGFSLTTAAVVMAWMSLVALAITPLAGRVIDRRGPWIVLIAGLVLASIGSFALAGTAAVPLALFATATSTTGWSIAASAESTMLSRLSGGAAKEWVFGSQYIVSSIGIGIGAIISGFVIDTSSPDTFVAIFVVNGFTYLAYTLVLLTMPNVGRAPDGPEKEVAPARFREALRDRTFVKLLAIYTLFFLCTIGQIESGFPAYATQVGDVAPDVLGIAILVNTFVVAAGQFLVIPRLVGRGRTRMLFLCSVTWATAWLVIGASGLVPATTLASFFVVCGLLVFALAEVVAAPVAPALINDMAPERLRGSYNAANGLAFSLGSTLGPLVTAVTIGTGQSWLWVAAMSGGILTAGTLIRRLGRHLTPQQQGLVLNPEA